MLFQKKHLDSLPGEGVLPGKDRYLLTPGEQTISGRKIFSAFPVFSAPPESPNDIVTRGYIDSRLDGLAITKAHTFELTAGMIAEKRATLPITVNGPRRMTKFKVGGSLGFISAVEADDPAERRENGFRVVGENVIDWSENMNMWRASVGDLVTVLYCGYRVPVPGLPSLFTHFATGDPVAATLSGFKQWQDSNYDFDNRVERCSLLDYFWRGDSLVAYVPQEPVLQTGDMNNGALVLSPNLTPNDPEEWGYSVGGVLNLAHARSNLICDFAVLPGMGSDRDVEKKRTLYWGYAPWSDSSYANPPADYTPIPDGPVRIIISTGYKWFGEEFPTAWKVIRSGYMDGYNSHIAVAEGEFPLSDVPLENGTEFLIALICTGGELEASVTINGGTKQVLYTGPTCHASAGPDGTVRVGVGHHIRRVHLYYDENEDGYIGSPVCVLDWMNFQS